METKKVIRALSLGGSMIAFAFGAAAIPGRIFVTPQDPQPDNTAANKKQNDAPNADQQKETPADRELTRKIRQSIGRDKSLSVYAHNVKVISRDGMVTLRGPVRSEDEKRAIAAKAVEIARASKVDDQLAVAP